MAYKVILEGSNDRVDFLFRNNDDAFQFANMAVEFGTYRDFLYEPKDGDAYGVKVEDEPRPIQVTIMGVEE